MRSPLGSLRRLSALRALLALFTLWAAGDSLASGDVGGAFAATFVGVLAVSGWQPALAVRSARSRLGAFALCRSPSSSDEPARRPLPGGSS